jgi:hypothetical protein
LLRCPVIERAMLAQRVVPVHIFFDMLPCVIKAGELKAVEQFPLLYGMERFDVRIFFGSGYMGKLLAGFHILQSLAHFVGNELRAVVIAYNDA